jgi:hypothetical protein
VGEGRRYLLGLVGLVSGCSHQPLSPKDRDSIHHVLLVVEQQAGDGPESPVIPLEEPDEPQDPIVARAADRVCDGISDSVRSRLCDVANGQQIDHLLWLSGWGHVPTLGNDAADDYYVDATTAYVGAAGFIVDCVTERVLWRDSAPAGEFGTEKLLEGADRAVAKVLDRLSREDW